MSGPRPGVDPTEAVAALRAQGADDDTVHRFLTQTLGLEELSPTDPSPTQVMTRNARRTPAGLQRLEQSNADLKAADEPTWAANLRAKLAAPLATAAATGRDIPGVEAAQAGASALANDIPYSDALRSIRGAEENLPAPVRIGARLGGLGLASAATGLPAAGRALAANIGTKGAGAVLGGGVAALTRAGQADPESVGSRVSGTALAGGLGAGFGVAAPWVVSNPIARTIAGGAVGAALAPKGYGLAGAGAGAVGAAALPSLIGKFGDKMGGALGDIRQAIGTRGLVNRNMADIQSTLTPTGGIVGADPGSGAVNNAVAKQFYDKADELFAQARGDRSLLNDPKVMQLMADPDVQTALNATARIRADAGNPLAQQGGAIIPDPEALHLTKRILRDVVARGQNAASTIPLEDAIRVGPKVDALTELLHDRSSAYAKADEFFNMGKIAEEGTGLGYGADKSGQLNPSASGLGETDVAGAQQFAATRPTPEGRSIAQAAIQEGAAQQLKQQIAKAGVGGGLSRVLNVPILGESGPATNQRALALGSAAPDFEQTLIRLREQAANDMPKGGKLSQYLHFRTGPVMSNLHGEPPNPLAAPGAATIKGAVTTTPAAYQNTLAQHGRGMNLLDLLRVLGGIPAGSLAGNLSP